MPRLTLVEWDGADEVDGDRVRDVIVARDRWYSLLDRLVSALATASIGDHPASRGVLEEARQAIEQANKEQ